MPRPLPARLVSWSAILAAALLARAGQAQDTAAVDAKPKAPVEGGALVFDGVMPQAPEGFVALFDGRTLNGWHGLANTIDIRKVAAMPEAERAKTIAEWTADAHQHWKAEGGILINDGEGKYLATDKDYGDVHLALDYRTVAKADSGVYLRGSPQVQIWDYTKEGGKHPLGADKGSGGLWNNSAGAPGKDPIAFADKPFGQWNHLDVVQVGARTTVRLNGVLVVDHATMENYFDRKLPLFARGPIVLQTHGGAIEWKNLVARELTADEANQVLAAHGAAGFAPIFDGKSLDGWGGPVENYEIVGGVLRCKAGQGGTIFHKKELGDFVARVEFRLPPGGNNGLAIRYPGSGDTAYQGMCELQVLDDTDPKYGKLDPRQYHGSAYGIAPAVRGYLRPVGEWNFQEVTVRGPRIKVELNGSVILDADVSQVHDFMANSPHPGLTRTTGYFGFAGHNDPVEFRDVQVKPL